MPVSGLGYSRVDQSRSLSPGEDLNSTSIVPSPPRPRPFFIGAPRGRNSSDASDSDRERDTPTQSRVVKTRHHGHSASRTFPGSRPLNYSALATDQDSTLPPVASDPVKDGSATSLFTRPPPSSYNFPFQAYPGNPDPLPRRSSSETSIRRELSPSLDLGDRQASTSSPDLESSEFAKPNAPFMTADSNVPPSRSSSMSNIYRGSAAAALSSNFDSLPRINALRGPVSRPSSIWQPPLYSIYSNAASTPNEASSSNPSLLVPQKKLKRPSLSTKLEFKLTTEDKPWLQEKDWRLRLSWWLTIFFWFLGACGGAGMCYFSWTGVRLLNNNQLCQVFSDNFATFDTSIWTKDVELGGFGNGEFQMTTNSNKNLYISNGQLYIFPTLTSDEIGTSAIFNQANYTLQGCTTKNASACTAASNSAGRSVINPVQTARISTQNSYSIKYGKVEIVAKLPKGDWLWPAIWMLPVNSNYGPWPASGEIDIMEARGNSPSYPAQGSNFVRSSLNYGPFSSIMASIYGWQSQKRSSYDQAFHTYTLEWTPSWMRASVDSKLKTTLDLVVQGKGGKSFWNRGNFPKTAQNGSTQVVVNDVYSSPSAPFDQNFYLILDLAAGGTSGWFPDGVGNKPWYDGSDTAMYDFAKAQDTWAATWPSNPDDRAFRINSVKMWSMC